MDRKRLPQHMRYAVLAIVAVGAIYMAVFYFSKPSPTLQLSGNSTPVSKRPYPTSALPLEKNPVHIYFKDKNMFFLVAETREVVYTDDPILLGKTILEMLIKGPEQEFAPTIPQETGLRAFYIGDDGTAYADLTENIQAYHPGGSTTELITIYSIVNSLVLNLPMVKQAKILINGRESMTLAGHIDIRNPFKANMLMVR